MWKLLYQFASPKTFYESSGRLSAVLILSALVLLGSGLVWGLWFAPADYQQGDAFRLIYMHVPCAFMSLFMYAWMGFLAVLLLVWRIKLAGIMLYACAQVGASMALLALVSGSIWGKPMWGTWWVWDARLTSELILFCLYAAILAAGRVIQNKEQGDRMIAVLTLVGLVDLPIIHYSVYWWNTLHQGMTLSLLAKPKIHTSMLYPLLLCLMGMGLYAVSLVFMKTRYVLLIRERRQSWVRRLVEGAPL